MKEKYDTLQLEIEAIIEQWKHLFQSNESYSKFRDKANIYVEEAYKFVEKFYFQLSLQHTSKQLAENLKTRDKPRGMDTNDVFSPDEPAIREIVRQEIKVPIKIPHSGKMSQSKRGRSVTIKKSPIKSLKIFDIAPCRTSENGNRDKGNWDDQAEEVGHKVSERKMAGLFGK